MNSTAPALTLIRRDAQGARRRRDIAPQRVRGWLASLAGRRIAVVGDLMLDAFLWGDAVRISPEAPVPVVLLERQTHSLGGAANVAANIAALGGEACLFGGVGDDDDGDKVIELLRSTGIGAGGVLRLPRRATTVKHRVFARNKHMLRFDHEDASPFPAAAATELLRRLRADGRFDAVVISDYLKGCIGAGLARAAGNYCRHRGLKLCVDPKNTALRHPAAWIVKPNLAELEALSGLPVRTEDELRAAARRTLRRQGCRYLLVTRGRDGMALFGRDGSEVLLHGGERQVADVTGAGDTVAAMLVLALGAGREAAEAALLANLAAGFVITLPGTAVARTADLLGELPDS